MDQIKFYETAASWARIGGIVGIVVTFLLFGFSAGPGGAQGILFGGLKGFVGGGLGAAIFYCLAGLIFAPQFASKLGSLAVVGLLGFVALFLANRFSDKFRSFTDPYSDIQTAVVVSSSNTTVAPNAAARDQPKYIVVIVSPPLRMGTNSIFGIGNEEELLRAAKELSDNDPEFEVIVQPMSIDEDDLDEVINIFRAAGIKNVRGINDDDYLRMSEEQ